MKPLHEELKQRRLELNITLQDVASATKIRLDFLERLENGDITMAPSPFVRAFLREYAQNVGIDPDKAMAKLDQKIDTVLEPVAEIHTTIPHKSGQPTSLSGSAFPDERKPAPETGQNTVAAPEQPKGKTRRSRTPKSVLTPLPIVPPESSAPAVEQQASLFAAEQEPVHEKLHCLPGDETAADTAQEDTVASPSSVVSPPVMVSEPAAINIDKEKDEVEIPQGTLSATRNTSTDEQNRLDDTHGAKNNKAPSEPGKLRHTIEIEEQNSVSNIVFTIIIIIILVAAGVFMYLNRGKLF